MASSRAAQPRHIPMLFDSNMVNAIRLGNKTQTRRLVTYRGYDCLKQKEGNLFVPADAVIVGGENAPVVVDDKPIAIFETDGAVIHATYPAQEGDIIDVREAWRIEHLSIARGIATIEYMADSFVQEVHFRPERAELFARHQKYNGWRPSIFLPAEAVRFHLLVEDCKPQKLLSLSDSEIRAEGICEWSKDGKLQKYAPADMEGDYPCVPWQDCPRTLQDAMELVWNETITEEALPHQGYKANPWVWAYKFRKQ